MYSEDIRLYLSLKIDKSFLGVNIVILNLKKCVILLDWNEPDIYEIYYKIESHIYV